MNTFYKLFTAALITMVLSTGNLNAQAFWGIYGGINTASLKMGAYVPDEYSDFYLAPTFEPIRRVTFGVAAELPIRHYFILQPEIALVQRGGIVSRDTGYQRSNIGDGNMQVNTVNNINLNYIQVPILLKWRIQLTHPDKMYPQENSGKPFFMDIYAGPAFNYLLMANSEYSYTVSYQNNDTGEDTVYKVSGSGSQAGLNKIDFSAMAGLNFRWKFSKRTNMWLDLRYTMNFFNINSTYMYSSVGSLSEADGYKEVYPTIKNGGNLAVTLGISTTFTKRRYWNHPRMKRRKF